MRWSNEEDAKKERLGNISEKACNRVGYFSHHQRNHKSQPKIIYRHEIIISVYFYIFFLTLFLTYFSSRNRRVIEVLDSVKAAKEIKKLETKDVEICEKLNEWRVNTHF